MDHINGYNEYLARRKRSIVVSSLQLSPSTFQFCIVTHLELENVTYTFSAVAAVAAASRIANDKFSGLLASIDSEKCEIIEARV